MPSRIRRATLRASTAALLRILGERRRQMLGTRYPTVQVLTFHGVPSWVGFTTGPLTLAERIT